MATNGYVLYIEDCADSRTEGLREIGEKQPRHLENVLIPASATECSAMINTYTIVGALVDFRLADWTGSNYETPVLVDDTQAMNGIDLAIQIARKFPDARIALFSANEKDLLSKFEQRTLPVNIGVVSQEGLPRNDSYRYVSDFVGKVFGEEELPIQLLIRCKPLHHQESLSPILQTYYCKKILTSWDKGKYRWKAGKVTWLAAVNDELQQLREKDIEKMKHFTLDNPEETFIIRLDSNDFFLKELMIARNGFKVNRSELYRKLMARDQQLEDPPAEYGFLHHLILARFICDLYLGRYINAEKAITLLTRLNQSAILESQKILFKEYYRLKRVRSKEEIYEGLAPFVKAGLPKVLDVFRGFVKEVEEEIAYVNLKSYAPEKVDRPEEFDAGILEDNGIEKDGFFEYTVYSPPIGGHAYHIEPV